jgi:hypothetical protein
MLEDEYLLDALGTCEVIADYHNCSYPSDIFCVASDAMYGNLMYWGLPYDAPPQDYFISSYDLGMGTPQIDSQAENVAIRP